jgi:hypothetical protein
MTRAGLAIAWGLVAATALYAIVRGVQYVAFPEPNPALVVWSAHSGYFWRLWIVAYAGGAAAFVAWLVARDERAEERAARALAAAAPVAGALVAAQAVFLP